MLKTDYLPRIVAPGVVNNVFNQGRKAFEVGATPTTIPTMPIEFSIAAFRLGHAMVRDVYDWNAAFPSGAGHARLPVRVLRPRAALFRRRAAAEQLDRRLAAAVRLQEGAEPQRPRAARLAQQGDADRHHARPHAALRCRPEPTGDDTGGIHDDLAFRNLRRAQMVRLATGQQMATFLKRKGVTLTKLTRAQIRDGKNGAKLDGLTPGQRDGAADQHPAVVLRPARGRAQQRQAQRRRRADRGRDVPPRDGGQHVLDRPRPGVEADARARTTARSA